jgi:hypothetical protein
VPYRSVLFAALYLAVSALAYPTWTQPPVWDTTMGLFPAAQVLAETGFDLRDLLTRPGWEGGGPNLHPFSLVTWGTAGVLRWTQGPEAFAWLHALHYAIGAGVGVLSFRLAAPALGSLGAGAVVGLLLLFPLFRVQLGYLYTELPLALATTGAVLAYTERRVVAAVVWSALACAIKETGVLVPVALAVASAVEPGAGVQRARRLCAWLALPAISAALQVAFVLPSREGESGASRAYAAQLGDAFDKLAMLPDWALALGLYGVVCVVSAPRLLRALQSPEPTPERSLALGALVVGAFFAFFGMLPLVGTDEYLLPRYYVQIAPLVFIGLAVAAVRWTSPRRAAAGAVVLALFFVLNREGRFVSLYPPVRGNEFSLAERSLEYRDLLAVQQQAMAAAQALPPALPLYYGLPEHYLFQYARSGYASAPRANGRCIWLDPVARRARLADFPDRFAILVNFLGYGGAQFGALLRQAERDPAWRIERRRFQQGRYGTALVQLTRTSGAY